MSLFVNVRRVVGAIALVALPLVAHADPAGQRVLEQVDQATNRFQDQSIVFDVVNQEPGRKEPTRDMSFSTRVKGEKSMTEFLSPGDVKGTRILVLDRTQMYIYLPQFNKVRRIASHMTEQGFMGTAYMQADMATRYYAPLYDATLASETDTAWVLELTAKEGVETAYVRGRFTIEKARSLPTELAWMNAEGEVIKTETRSDYRCEGEICTPGRMRMTDHVRNGAWTELVMSSWQVNEGLSDDLFSTRELQH